MRDKNTGFILLMTLLIISVLSLLSLTSLHHVLLYYKSINTLQTQHHTFHQLEHLAVQIAKTKFSELDKHCVLIQDMANQVITQLKQQQGCSMQFANSKYHYYIEEIDDFPCLIAQHHGEHVATHHRRVSVMLLANKGPNSLLQIRYISPISVQPCIGARHKVALGLSSWRYFAAI